jgi:hypothetical protein
MSRLSLLLLFFLLGCAAIKQREVEPQTKPIRRQPSGLLIVNCDPPDALLYVDGRLEGAVSDFSSERGGRAVSLGPHRIVISKEGYYPYRAEFIIDERGLTINVRLKKREPPE